jgi:hypothetical protein
MNYRQLILMMTLLGLLAQGAIAGESKSDKILAKKAPLFERIKLRGAVRDDVSRDVIKQNPGEGYQLRVVKWWPKQGVDFIEEPKGKPRTWTIRPESMAPREPGQQDYQAPEKWWPRSLRGKKKFEAHLIGFRGLGAINDPWGDDLEKPFAPAIVLRLPDGRKRCFIRGSFSDADELYVTKLYEKQMKVLRDNTFEEGIDWVASSSWRDRPLSDNPLYTEGMTTISSKHFTASLGSEPPDDGGRSRWLDWHDKEGAARRRKIIMRGWEDMWAYMEHGGQRMNYWDHSPEKTKYKYRIKVKGTKLDGKTMGRGSLGGFGGCSVNDGSWLALYHEWGHGIPSGAAGSLGGGETLSDAGQLIGEPGRVSKSMFQMVKPWKNLFYGQYPGAYAWTVIGDDPNWGYVFPYAMATMMSMQEPTPMHAIARVGEKRGLFKDPIRETGDLFGQVGARFAELDNELQAGLRGYFCMPNRVPLIELDRETRHYRSDQKCAPEAFGVNIVRLVADKGAKELTVDFEGHYDPKTFSDWRACIVAVDREGKCRYSPLWNKGKMSLKTQPDDLRYWLTVTATPTALSPAKGLPTRNHYTHVVYQGGFGYRYPYDVTLAGCRAGSPHTTLFEDDVAGQAGMFAGRREQRYDGAGMLSAAIPVTDPEQRKQLEAALAGLDDHEAAQWHLRNSKGKRHANGGGWVADSAEVAATAYVAPHAMVLDTAKVLDNAVVDDYVIAYGDVVFKDNARVFGKLAIKKGVHSGNSRMYIRNETRTSAQQISPEDDSDAPQRRLGPLTGSAAFQANYECFQPEAVLLEDHYNERTGNPEGGVYGVHQDDRIFFDGHLIGNPGFTEDGAEEGAFTFNGKNQWAELPGEMADLEVITLDMRLKVDSDKAQTVWMFGNDEQNHLFLSAAGGQWVLAGRAGDAQAECRGGKVTQGEWTVVRAELDGQTMTLFQDGKNIAQTKTDFRASDAFVPGKIRLATMAAGIGGRSPMTGAVDYFRALSEVVEDFSKVEVPLLCPRRISPKVYERFIAKYIDSGYAAKRKEFVENQEKTHPLTAYFGKYYAAVNQRKEDLAASGAERIKEINAETKVLRDKVNKMNQEMREAQKNDEAYQKLVAELRPMRDEISKKMDDQQNSFPGYKEAVAAERELNSQYNALRRTAQTEMNKDPEYIALQAKIKEQSKKIQALPQGSSERRKLESDLTHKLRKGADAMVSKRHKQLPGARELEGERKKAQTLCHQVRQAAQNTDAYQKLEKERRELDVRMRYKQDPKLVAERNKVDKEIGKSSGRIRNVKEAAAAETNALEAYLLRKSGWSRDLAHQTKKMLSGHTPHVPEDVKQLNYAKKLQAMPWPTTVDWGGRAKYESDKEAMAQPVMQHYLKRMKPWMYE